MIETGTNLMCIAWSMKRAQTSDKCTHRGKGTSQSQQRLSRRHRRRIRMTTNRQWRMDTVYPNSRDRHHSETSGSQLVDRCVRNLILKSIYAAAMTITYLNWCYKDIFIYFFCNNVKKLWFYIYVFALVTLVSVLWSRFNVMRKHIHPFVNSQ